jgi:hypothetical protein
MINLETVPWNPYRIRWICVEGEQRLTHGHRNRGYICACDSVNSVVDPHGLRRQTHGISFNNSNVGSEVHLNKVVSESIYREPIVHCNEEDPRLDEDGSCHS